MKELSSYLYERRKQSMHPTCGAMHGRAAAYPSMQDDVPRFEGGPTLRGYMGCAYLGLHQEIGNLRSVVRWGFDIQMPEPCVDNVRFCESGVHWEQNSRMLGGMKNWRAAEYDTDDARSRVLDRRQTCCMRMKTVPAEHANHCSTTVAVTVR